MGDTRKHRSKLSRPSHPWQKDRIEEEKVLVREFGLSNKKDLWKSSSLFKNATKQAKTLIPLGSEQARKEEAALLQKLVKLGLLAADAKIEDVLNISTKSILDRRLQTIIFRKGLAKSMKQARQFITHGHIIVSGKKISSPSYLVTLADENNLVFAEGSSLADEAHPERAVLTEEAKKGKTARLEKRAAAMASKSKFGRRR